MSASINKAFKLRGLDPVFLKKAKKFFEHDTIWACEKMRSDLEEYRAAHPGPQKSSYRQDFFIGDTFKVMQDAGFVKILDETTWSISYEPRPERYCIWAHPSGVLFLANTYQYNPEGPEEFQTLTRGELISVINVGFSRMGYHGSLGLSSASSSSGHMGMTGEAYTSRRNSVSSPYEIISELDNIQKTGRIVPFHQQNLAEVSIHSSVTLKLPLNDWEKEFSDITQPKTREEMYEHLEQYGQKYARKVWQRGSDNVPVLNNIIPQLGTVLAVSMYHHGYSYGGSSRQECSDLFNKALSQTASEFGIYENPSKRQTNEGMWMGPHVDKNTIINFYNVEGAAHFVGHIQDYEQQRYLSRSDQKLVQEWLHGIKNHHQNVEWEILNTTQTTSTGIALVHLCIAQDACEYWDENSQKSLGLKAIEYTPEKVLHTACTQPLADGSTLPLMIVQEYLRMISEFNFAQRVLCHTFGDILKALDKKVPAHLWVCGEGTSNTLDGLWLQQLYNLRSSAIVSKSQWDEICAPLLELGVVPPSHCALRLPLRSKPTEKHNCLDYLATEHINRPSLEEAFDDLIKDMPHSWKETRLNLLLKNILVSTETPLAKRKM